MRERFARWLLLLVAVALTVLGRPDGPCGQQVDHDQTASQERGQVSLHNEQRRYGVRGGAEIGRAAKPICSVPLAWDVPPRFGVVPASARALVVWTEAPSNRAPLRWRRPSAARGPPARDV